MHSYPTPYHEVATNAIVGFFAARPEPVAVVLVNSCARGKATPTSDLDLVVLVPPGSERGALEAAWEQFRTSDPAIATFTGSGPFAILHLDIEEAVIDVPTHPDDEYPDGFELVIGNWLVWGVALWERDGFHRQWRDQWLPYYGDALRATRLAEIRRQCEGNLRAIPAYVARGLYFQAFSRLWQSFQLFLQALFIQRRTYPLAYDKWIREQVVEILALPEVYAALPPLFEIARFESDALTAKATDLQRLLDQYVPGGAPAPGP